MTEISKFHLRELLGLGAPNELSVDFLLIFCYFLLGSPNVGAGASGIWEHREETQRPLHETMRLAEAWLMRHAPGGSMPSQTLKHCKIQSRKDAPKMAILEAPCAQNAPGRSTMRLPEALLPRNPTWESSHFWGLTKKKGKIRLVFPAIFKEKRAKYTEKGLDYQILPLAPP